MSATRAKWGLDRFQCPDDDPFDDPVDVAVAGTPIDLTDENRDLAQQLVALHREEQQRGVVCQIKEMDGTTCGSCPIRAQAPAFPLSRLCMIGVEQERLTTLLAARHHGATT